MRHRVIGHTALGQVKPTNEDSHLHDPELGLVAVCDGMGGRAGGEVASALACELLQSHLRPHRDVFENYARQPNPEHRSQVFMVLRGEIDRVCGEIHARGQEKQELQGMATTLVCMLMLGRHAVIAHAGDSRAYLVRDHKAHVLTDDHTVVRRQLQRGLITPEDALYNSQSHIVTRALGLSEHVEAEILDVEVMPGDAFVLCSDGLSRYVTTEEIAKAVAGLPFENLAPALVRLADQRSGKDNITVVALQVAEDQAGEGLSADQKIDALRQINLFQNLTYLEAIRVLSVVSSRAFPAGAAIVEEDGRGQEFFVGVVGSFSLRIRGQEVGRLPAGGFFGEMTLISEERQPYEVVALEPARVLVIAREDFLALTRAEPYLGAKFLANFCKVLAERDARGNREVARLRRELKREIRVEEAVSPFDLADLAQAVESATP